MAHDTSCQPARVAPSTQTTLQAVASCLLHFTLKYENQTGALGREEQKARERGLWGWRGLPREVNDVGGSAGGRVAEHIAEAVAPLELIGQVGLASHEVIARFCSPFKGDDDLCIHL